jgi:hypothetical protein
MSVRVKSIKRKIKGAPTEKEIAKIFNQLLGTEEVNLAYALPRFTRMVAIVAKILKINNVMKESFFCGAEDAFIEFREFDEQLTMANNLIKTIPEFDAKNLVFNTIPQDQVKEFTKVYNSFRDNHAVRKLVLSASRIKPFVEDIKANKYDYIYKTSGTSLCLLSFCEKFNFLVLRTLSTDTVDPLVKIWSGYLKNIFEAGKTIGEELVAPDMDIKEFSKIVIMALEAAEKDPALHDCKQAFAKIKESMHLLESNFKGYYREFVQSSNDPLCILQNFISDVTNKNSDSSINILAQFTKIVDHFRKKMDQNGIRDKNTNDAMEMLSNGMEALCKSAATSDVKSFKGFTRRSKKTEEPVSPVVPTEPTEENSEESCEHIDLSNE